VKNTADVTGGKPIAVLLQSISGVRPINPLVAFYDIHGGKRGVILLFCPGPTRDNIFIIINYLHKTLKAFQVLTKDLIKSVEIFRIGT
jgi:hypothetical protein